ncbi:hypothetical protein KAI92_02805 [Candidatus Parcubacteria bacterium]|nr:hypothetical protein [Candidatus Parcubacteria bacterium]
MIKLIDFKDFKNCLNIDDIVPDFPGIYCLKIKDINFLPKEFTKIFLSRKHKIIYIGIATKSLKERFLNQELRGKGHGTFFRSMGAILGFKPPRGSLVDKKNKYNYKFSKKDELKIINWINKHLTASWIETDSNLNNTEDILIKEYQPLVNLKKNPFALKQIKELRKKCQEIANTVK